MPWKKCSKLQQVHSGSVNVLSLGIYAEWLNSAHDHTELHMTKTEASFTSLCLKLILLRKQSETGLLCKWHET